MTSSVFKNKCILVTGGTGSLGQVLVRRLLTGEMGMPARIIVLSRDEAKQHDMRLRYLQRTAATDDVIYDNSRKILSFRIGDVRDYSSVSAALREVDIVFSAAALKQVPTCEYFPFEAVLTNVGGPENLVRAIRDHHLKIETAVSVSTDKACKPVNVMGMTKALQERIFIRANMEVPETRFICVRYGNVLASRGSVIPLFRDQIRQGGPVTITSIEMTRFLLSLNQAVDTIFSALLEAAPGEIYVPRVPAARVTDIAEVIIDRKPIKIVVTGIRPGEKTHEILVSEEEAPRTVERGKHYYAVLPILPELRSPEPGQVYLNREYSSADDLMTKDQLRELLVKHQLLSTDNHLEETELLR